MNKCCLRTVGGIKTFLRIREKVAKAKEKELMEKKRKSRDDRCSILVYYCRSEEAKNLRNFLGQIK